MSNHDQWPIVEVGATLTIEPGVIIMPENPNYTFLEIRGTLKAEGTASDKIVFTPKNDSDYGGAGGAVAGSMKNILFTSTSTNSVLDYTLFRYGGKSGEVIKIDGSSVEIKNSTIEDTQLNGIYLNNSNSKIKNTIIKNGTGTGIIVEGSGNTPEISDCQINNYAYGIDIKDGTAPKIKNNSFSENATAPIYLRDARPEFSNNSAINNAYNGIMVGCLTLITQDTTWDKGLVYILEMNSGDYVTINENVTLTIKPGAILKPINHYYTPLVIKGTLRAEGSSGNEIIFTSIKDDTMGGDTNNDSNATTPTDSDWKKIIFETTSTGSVLDNVKMFYGSGEPELVGSASVEIKTVDYTP
jgi:parallel beta-helix repeat protein